VLLAAFLTLALAELLWAAATLARDAPPALRLIPALALLPMMLWAALAVAGATGSGGTAVALPLIPMAASSLLDVAVAATAAVAIRRGPTARAVTGRTATLRFAVAIVLSVCAVAAVVLPALEFTQTATASVTVHHRH
jgi:hypothetical protein